MAKAPFPSDTQDKFMLRLPDGMRDRVRAAAEANNRSMNAEIVATLEERYPPPIQSNELTRLLRHQGELFDRIMDEHDSSQREALVAEFNAVRSKVEKMSEVETLALFYSGDLQSFLKKGIDKE